MKARLIDLLKSDELDEIKNNTSVNVNSEIRYLTLNELFQISVKKENISSTISEVIKRSNKSNIQIF